MDMGSYFQNGQPIGAIPPQAAAGFGAIPPQAAAGFGQIPPQAAAGIGQSFGPGGALPPNVQALSPALPGGMRPWRDGVFAASRYAPEPFGEQERPWRDGIFGPGLGQTGNGNVVDLSKPAGVKEIKLMLNYVLCTQEGCPISQDKNLDLPYWDAQTEQAYTSWAALMPSSAEMLAKANGHTIPSNLGILSLYANARMSAEQQLGPDAGVGYATTYWPRAAAFYDTVFADCAAGGSCGTVIAPEFGGGGPMRATTIMYVAGGALALGVGMLLLRKKKRK